jgi:hypothetical protein
MASSNPHYQSPSESSEEVTRLVSQHRLHYVPPLPRRLEHWAFLEAGDGSGQFSAMPRFVSAHKVSIGLRSAPQGGQSRSSTSFWSASHPRGNCDLWTGDWPCSKLITPSGYISRTEGTMISLSMWRYWDPSKRPSVLWSNPIPREEIHPQTATETRPERAESFTHSAF